MCHLSVFGLLMLCRGLNGKDFVILVCHLLCFSCGHELAETVLDTQYLITPVPVTQYFMCSVLITECCTADLTQAHSGGSVIHRKPHHHSLSLSLSLSLLSLSSCLYLFIFGYLSPWPSATFSLCICSTGRHPSVKCESAPFPVPCVSPLWPVLTPSVAFFCGTGVHAVETGGAEVQGRTRRNRHPTGDLFPRDVVVSWGEGPDRLWPGCGA